MPMGIGILDARVHREFQRLGVYLHDARLQLPAFVRFVGRPLAELAVTHHVDAAGVGFERLYARTLGGQVDGAGRLDALRGRGRGLEGEDSAERAVALHWPAAYRRELGNMSSE